MFDDLMGRLLSKLVHIYIIYAQIWPYNGFWLITQQFLFNMDEILYTINMDVAARRAPVVGWGLRPPQKFGHGS